MSETGHFASLSPRLLARKGTAKPAMRRQDTSRFTVGGMPSRTPSLASSLVIPAGQAAWHSLVLVQAPKPSSSIRSTIAVTRCRRSDCPWGSRAS